jgi:hypothetical protein
MAVRLSAPRTGRTLLPRNIFFFVMFPVLISVRGWVNPWRVCDMILNSTPVHKRSCCHLPTEPLGMRVQIEEFNQLALLPMSARASLKIAVEFFVTCSFRGERIKCSVIGALYSPCAVEWDTRDAIRCGITASSINGRGSVISFRFPSNWIRP